jgi:hypothetical protein
MVLCVPIGKNGAPFRLKIAGVQMQRKHRWLAFALVVVGVVAALAALHFARNASIKPQSRGALAAAKNDDADEASAKGRNDAAALSNAASAEKHPATARHLHSAVSNASAAPLPAPGTPLKQTLADLKARADAGDAAAASRLFQDMQRCAEAARINQSTAIANRGLGDNTDPAQMSPGALQRNDRMLGMMQRNLQFAQDNASLCAGIGADQLADLVPATLEAAQLGDSQAANCYVGANLNTWPGLLDNPDWIAEYKSNALSLAGSAVQQGDWTMVGMLASAYNGGGRNTNMLAQLTGANLAQAYSYAKLMSLGQPQGTNSTRLTNNLTNLAGQLTPDQIQAADSWAQNMYQQNFNSTPRTPGQVGNAMQACQGGPG